VCECETCTVEWNAGGAWDTCYLEYAYNEHSGVFLELNLSRVRTIACDRDMRVIADREMDWDGNCAEAGLIYLHLADHRPSLDLRDEP
jgi:hypothetical protein